MTRRSSNLLSVRSRLTFALLALASFAAADRLITIPTARKLLDGTFRLESLRELGNGRLGTDYLAAGLGPQWEAEARVLRYDGRDPHATADVTYNVLSAVPGFSPGFAVGVQDAFDETGTGTRLFGLTTIRNQFQNTNVPFDVTIGLFVGRRTTPFLGTSVPVYRWARVLAEHDGDRGRIGFEALPAKGFRVRLTATDGRIAGSVGYTAGF